MASNFGGQEWYELRPNKALDLILDSLQECRSTQQLALLGFIDESNNFESQLEIYF